MKHLWDEVVDDRAGRDSPVPFYAGLGLVLLGFVLIAYTWARVAGTLAIQVQLPYIISGGLTGLALVVAGSTAVNVAIRRRESARRQEQLEALGVILDALADVWGADDREEEADRS